MKKMKRLAALFLAFVLLMGLTVFAEEYSITITNNSQQLSMEGTYKAYKIFDVTYNEAQNAYSYTVVKSFEDFSYTAGGETYSGENLIEYLSTLEADSEEVNEFAEAVNSYIKEKSIAESGSAEAGTENSVTIPVEGPGYYLVTAQGKTTDGENSTVTAMCGLTTTDPNGNVNLKADAPTVDKEVKEADDNAWGKVADNTIGETVEFKLHGTIPSYAAGYDNYTYVFHDALSAGLTLDTSSIKVYSDESLTNQIESADYTLKTTGIEDGCSFEVLIASDYIKAHQRESVYVGYKATLNENAVIWNGNNDNKVYIEYSNNPYDSSSKETTPEKEVKVYTYQFDIFKYYKNDGKKEGLAGAQFKLYSDKDMESEIKLIKIEGNQTAYRVAKAGETPTADYIESPASGDITIQGLDAGTYYLKETKAPAGYNLLKEAIKVTITAVENDNKTEMETVTIEQDESQTTKVEVENKSGSILPSTGGIGTAVFYLGGGFLMLGAAVLLVVRKRMAEKE